jgi:hypothetical protein
LISFGRDKTERVIRKICCSVEETATRMESHAGFAGKSQLK